ncbi:MAG: 4Fe-4S binding protein, partial [Chloroflexi bacterium]|nr:4Fe-4S binding protein [Chloroflexota bacterium]
TKQVERMKAHYGYADGSGEYFIAIDTDDCDGCGHCVTACPENVFEMAEDDYGKMVATVCQEARNKLSYLCPGFNLACSRKEVNCHTACSSGAISHTW